MTMRVSHVESFASARKSAMWRYAVRYASCRTSSASAASLRMARATRKSLLLLRRIRNSKAPSSSRPMRRASSASWIEASDRRGDEDVEATLGLPLFERSNRGLEPTPYGEIFARHAKIVLAQLRHAAEELESLRVGYSGKVTVGTLLAASASILPDAIARLKIERPGVAISVVVGTYDILVPSLLVGDLDMVLGRLPEEGRSSALLYEEFYAEPICLVTRPGHPLQRKRRLGLRDLVNEAWLLPLPETTLRRQIERAFLEAHAPLPRNVIESVSILTNRVLLRKSDSIGIMPYHVALDDVEHKLLSILPVKLKSMETPVGAILRAPGNLPPAATALLECLRLAARDVPSPRARP